MLREALKVSEGEPLTKIEKKVVKTRDMTFESIRGGTIKTNIVNKVVKTIDMAHWVHLALKPKFIGSI